MELQTTTSQNARELTRANDHYLQLSRRRCEELLQREPHLRDTMPPEDRHKIAHECHSSIQCLEVACTRLYNDRSCLASRAFEVQEQQHPDEKGSNSTPANMATTVRYVDRFDHITYKQLWGRVQNLASGWNNVSAASDNTGSSGGGAALVKPGDMVGICGFGSPDWVVADLACMYLCATSVPLQTSMMPQDLQHIINETEMCSVVCSMKQLELIASVLPHCALVKNITVIDLNRHDSEMMEEYERWKQELQDGGRGVGYPVSICSIQELEQLGADNVIPYVTPREFEAQNGREALMTLVYTSGSTGTPKGAMYTENILLTQWKNPLLRDNVLAFPQISINFMPLNHLAGRLTICNSLMLGGTMYFVLKSDMSTLFEDIRIVRPTSMFLVPRISDMIYQSFLTDVVKHAAGKVDVVKNMEERNRIKREVMKKMRHTFLGDRLLTTSTGTAPTPPEVVSFLQECFQIPVFNTYGTTEIHSISFENRISRSNITDWKLVDVPALGYTTRDKPYPRGELYLKSPMLIPGYFKQDQATRDLMDDEGFMKTGDIVEHIGPDEVVWIDRKKNILKLQQGEFVSTSRLEGMYSKSPFILQVYIYGNSLRSYLLAVIVPHKSTVEQRLKQRGIEIADSSIKRLIRDDLNRISNELQLFSYEIPRDFILVHEPFTKENGLLTESNKPRRANLKAKFGPELEKMYKEIEEKQFEELHRFHDIHRTGADMGDVIERVKTAMSVTLGLSNIDVEQNQQSFIQLGGDSLSAVRLSNLLQQVCNVNVPVGFILDPSSSLRAIVQLVKDLVSGKSITANLSFEQAHGAKTTVIRQDQLDIDKFLGQENVNVMHAAVKPPNEEVIKTVLLTGANGFLGRFLLLELLRRLPHADGKVICIVRAANDSLAMERLQAGFKQGKMDEHTRDAGALWDEFSNLTAGGRLEVFAGDLIKPNLGLTYDIYERLCDDVDCVLHGGALVNHVFSYKQLFEPNVLGTVEVVRFATSKRIKPINFISSVSVAGGILLDPARKNTAHDPWVNETETGRQLWNERPNNSAYAVGYGTSKWACEVLLQDLFDKYNVPVNIFRCGMILAHSQFIGQINASDFFSRLLCGLVYTGIAPESFYEIEQSSGAENHFDGIPVDFVSQGIASVSCSRTPPTYSVFHCVNPYHDDNISLDTITDWVRSAGYKIDKVQDHQQWFRMFQEKLSSLNEQQRQHSPLPIIHQWEKPVRTDLEAKFSANLFQDRLRELQVNDSIPHLTESFIHKNLEHLQFLGLIDINK